MLRVSLIYSFSLFALGLQQASAAWAGAIPAAQEAQSPVLFRDVLGAQVLHGPQEDAGPVAVASAGAAAAHSSCAQEGLSLLNDSAAALVATCRVDDQEVRFEVFAQTLPPPDDVRTLQWQDWCARIVDQDGVTMTAVYGHERCLDAWLPQWRDRAEAGAVRDLPASQRYTDPVVFDCLGKVMDDSRARSENSPWMVLRALAHELVLTAAELR